MMNQTVDRCGVDGTRKMRSIMSGVRLRQRAARIKPTSQEAEVTAAATTWRIAKTYEVVLLRGKIDSLRGEGNSKLR